MLWAGQLFYTDEDNESISQIEPGTWFGYKEILTGAEFESNVEVPETEEEDTECVVLAIEAEVLKRFKQKFEGKL